MQIIRSIYANSFVQISKQRKFIDWDLEVNGLGPWNLIERLVLVVPSYFLPKTNCINFKIFKEHSKLRHFGSSSQSQKIIIYDTRIYLG